MAKREIERLRVYRKLRRRCSWGEIWDRGRTHALRRGCSRRRLCGGWFSRKWSGGWKRRRRGKSEELAACGCGGCWISRGEKSGVWRRSCRPCSVTGDLYEQRWDNPPPRISPLDISGESPAKKYQILSKFQSLSIMNNKNQIFGKLINVMMSTWESRWRKRLKFRFWESESEKS